MEHILAIDVGTTTLKVGLVGEDGRIVRIAKRPMQMDRPSQGAAVHNLQALTSGLRQCILDASSGLGSTVSTIVLSTYQWGLVLLDESDEPLTDISTFLDTRPQEILGEESADFRADDLYATTAIPALAHTPLARLRYFAKHSPKLLERARWYLSAKDYLQWYLTGERVTDPSMASATQVYNVRSRRWEERYLEALGIQSKCFPVVVDGRSTAFRLRRDLALELKLKPSADVLTGVYDGAASAIALSGLDSGVAISNFGTSAMIRVPWHEPVFDDAMQLQSYHLFGDTYFVGGALSNATLPLNWLKNLFAAATYRDLLAEALESPIGARGASCFPYLTGERDATLGGNASGVLVGLRDYHTRSDLVRAFLEGVAFSLALIVRRMRESRVTFSELRMGGGGTELYGWLQIVADVLNFPITLSRTEEAGIVGGAILGFTYNGRYKTLAEAVQRMTSAGSTISPDRLAVESYSAIFEKFCTRRKVLPELYG